MLKYILPKTSCKNKKCQIHTKDLLPIYFKIWKIISYSNLRFTMIFKTLRKLAVKIKYMAFECDRWERLWEVWLRGDLSPDTLVVEMEEIKEAYRVVCQFLKKLMEQKIEEIIRWGLRKLTNCFVKCVVYSG